MNVLESLNWIDGLVRPECEGFEPYLPGRSLESVRRELGLKRLIKLASNENPIGPSALALKAMGRAGKSFFRYPDGPSAALRAALARSAGLAVERVLIGAGSDELIELLGKTFLNRGDSIVVSEHAFIRYRMAGELMGATVISVPMRDFTHDLSAMADALRPDTKLLFIANPNNPTGTFNSHAQLERLLEQVAARTRGGRPALVVVDEAYYEYARAFERNYPRSLELQKRFSNLVVLRTFSKAHALAGLRVGYLFADPAIMAVLDRVRPPFNVSAAGQAAAEASLSDRRHIQRSIRLAAAERKKILAGLASLRIPFVPSAGNFVLCDVSPRRGKDVFEALLERGVIVRAMEEYGFPHHVRVTYGLPEENKFFLQALREVLVL